jgi:exonuclease III
MNISTDCYRAVIGIWYNVSRSRKVKETKLLAAPIKIKFFLELFLNSYGVLIGTLLILRCGDVHPNPGPINTTNTPNTNKALTICHANIQSLYLVSDRVYPRRKIDEIQAIYVNEKNIDIVCLSETWLKPTTDDTKVDIVGYKLYRKDRLDRPSGGVGMYITDRIPNRRADEYEVEDIELMWVEITLGVKKFLLGVCYRAPHQPIDEVEVFMSRIQESFELVYARNRETIILMGDFNDTCTQWDSDHELSDLKLKFYDFINDHDLHELVHKPTHILGPTANILDLLITNSPGYVNDLQILSPPWILPSSSICQIQNSI